MTHVEKGKLKLRVQLKDYKGDHVEERRKREEREGKGGGPTPTKLHSGK